MTCDIPFFISLVEGLHGHAPFSVPRTLQVGARIQDMVGFYRGF
jgi:hypothetical protein